MAYELIKVSELPELTTPSDPNVLPIQDGDYLKRISFANLKDAAVGDMEGSLAAAYDSTATYAVGDYCIYEGQLYRCTTAITTAEAWTAGHWTAAVLTDDIASDLSAEASTRSTNDNALAADIAETLGDLAAVYSTSATYAVGDYCIYQGQLYRCTTAITTAEAWTSGHWSAVALGDDTRDLRSALNAIDEVVTGSGSNAGGYTYDINFIVGKRYYLKNTSANTTINFNTYGNGAIIEPIKNLVAVGEIVEFVPSLSAPQLRVYYATSGGSFEARSGELEDVKKRITIIEGRDYDSQILNINNEISAMKFKVDIEWESGLYAGNPSVGDTHNPSITSNAAWVCAKIQVSKYDEVSFYGTASANTQLWILTDASNKVTEKTATASATQGTPVKITIAENGYLYLNSQLAISHGGFTSKVDGYAEIKEYVNDKLSEVGGEVYPLTFDFDVSGIPAQEDFVITSRDPQGIYDLYDALVSAYPDYVTKVDCSDADTEIEATRPPYLNGYPIYLYKFIPKIIYTESAIKRRMKIMILTGVHSNEKWNIYNVYRLMQYICSNWKTDKNAEMLRTLVDFWIIPVVNPWGFANAGIVENAGRVNGNGVNLNRNAPASNWQLTPTGADYSGSSAGSEYETQIWLYYHDIFNPDVFIDQHTPGMPDTGVFGVLETDITLDYLANVGDIICRTITNNLVKIDSNVPDSADVVLFDMYSDTNPGQVTKCAREHGTKYSFLFEMSDSSKWNNGVLTQSTVTGASSGIQIREQMRSIYNGWIRLIDAASHNVSN